MGCGTGGTGSSGIGLGLATAKVPRKRADLEAESFFFGKHPSFTSEVAVARGALPFAL